MHRLELKIPPAAVVLVFAGLMWVVAELATVGEGGYPGQGMDRIGNFGW